MWLFTISWLAQTVCQTSCDNFAWEIPLLVLVNSELVHPYPSAVSTLSSSYQLDPPCNIQVIVLTTQKRPIEPYNMSTQIQILFYILNLHPEIEGWTVFFIIPFCQDMAKNHTTHPVNRDKTIVVNFHFSVLIVDLKMKGKLKSFRKTSSYCLGSRDASNLSKHNSHPHRSIFSITFPPTIIRLLYLFPSSVLKRGSTF